MNYQHIRQKYIMDRESELETAEEKGIKKGQEEGIRKVAKELLKEKISVDVIVKTTGLTKEEILEL